MKATLLLSLGFDWNDERQYAEGLHETMERLREQAFADTVGKRDRHSDYVNVPVYATFDYEDEYQYAEKLVELVDRAREYGSAELLSVERGEGQASDGHMVKTDTGIEELAPQNVAAFADRVGQLSNALSKHGPEYA